MEVVDVHPVRASLAIPIEYYRPTDMLLIW
jgi:hypothetical protein